jgi:hypothetical protein
MNGSSATTDEKEYIEPTPSVRRGLLLALILALAPAGVFFAFWPEIQAHLRAQSACELIAWLQVLNYSTAALAGAAAGTFAWSGAKVLRHGQAPAPGSWVLRRTRVLRGSAARRRAWVLLAAASVLVLCAVLLLVQSPALTAALAGEFRCPLR